MQVGFDELSLGVEIEFSGITRFEAAQVLVGYFGTTLLGVVAALKEAGAITGANCGIHVHIGAEKFDPKSLRVLCNLVYSKQYQLANALTVREVRKVQYCSYLIEEFINQLNSEKPATWDHFKEIWYAGTFETDRAIRRSESRYRIVNLHNLLSGRQPTIEYRLYNSILDPDYTKAYVQFSLLLTCQALKQKKALTRMMMSENSKFTFRVFLLKTGAIGSTFREMRLLFLKHLEGDSGRRRPISKLKSSLSQTK